MSTNNVSPDSILNDLATGEDEFDIDLMAAGCRVQFNTEEAPPKDEVAAKDAPARPAKPAEQKAK
jgi:hypothetical protein